MGCGASCCGGPPELNPDGSHKEPQDPAQKVQDPVDLRKAAREGDVTQMEMLMRRMSWASINSGQGKNESGQVEERGNTALHYAASINHLVGIKKLVLYSATPTTRNAQGRTPLHMAAELGKRKACAYLLELKDPPPPEGAKKPPKIRWPRTANPNALDNKRASPLLLAFKSGRRHFTSWFIAACGVLGRELNYDVVDAEGDHAALLCARFGWWDLLEKTVIPNLSAKRAKAVLNVRNCKGETVLGWILKFTIAKWLDEAQCMHLLELLSQEQYAVSVLTPAFQEQVPPVSLAAATGHMPVFDKVLALGAARKVYTKDRMMRTPLHYAAARGHRKIATKLMNLHLSVVDRDKHQNTPFHLAAMRGKGDTSKRLLKKSTGQQQYNALISANNLGLNVYHLSLMSGGDEAAQLSTLYIIELIGTATAQIPVMDKKSDTPLLLAIRFHQDKVVDFLLERGVSCNEPNRLKEYPLARNMESVTHETVVQDSNIFDRLIEYGAQVETPNPYAHPLLAVCKTPVSMFAEKAIKKLEELAAGQVKIIRGSEDGDDPEAAALLDAPIEPKELDWDRKDEAGRSPMMIAAWHGNTYVIKYLLSKDFPIDAQTEKEGLTALMFAAQAACVDTVRVLLDNGASVDIEDNAKHSALWHCLKLDKMDSLTCASMMLLKGAKPQDITDITGEGFLHRAVRYGATEFIRLWAEMGGNMAILCSTPETADDMPGAEEVEDEKLDYLDDEAEGAEDDEFDEEGDDFENDDTETKELVVSIMDLNAQKEEGNWQSLGNAAGATSKGRLTFAGEDDTAAADDRDSGAKRDSGNKAKGSTSAKKKGSLADSALRAGMEQIRPDGDEVVILSQSQREAVLRENIQEEDEPDTRPSDTIQRMAQGGPEAVAEGMLDRVLFDDYYQEPSAEVKKGWMRQGVRWFDRFLDDVADVPPEDDPFHEELVEAQERGWDKEEATLKVEDVAHYVMDKWQQHSVEGGPVAEGVNVGGPQDDADIMSAVLRDLQMRELEAQGYDVMGMLARGEGPAAVPPEHYARGGAAAQKLHEDEEGEWAGRCPSLTRSSSLKLAPTWGAGGAVGEGVEGGVGRKLGNQLSVRVGGGGGGGSLPGSPRRSKGWWLMRGSVDDCAVAGRRPSWLGAHGGSGLGGGAGAGPVAEAFPGGFQVPGSLGEVVARAASATEELKDLGELLVTDHKKELKKDKMEMYKNAKQSGFMDRMKDKALNAVMSVGCKEVISHDPYFSMVGPEDAKVPSYKGQPQYLQHGSALLDVSKVTPDMISAEAQKVMAALADYKAKDTQDPPLAGPGLRERNIKWWNKSLSPEEYPLKMGQWKKLVKKEAQAMVAARNRRPAKPKTKIKPRSRTAWFGLPDLPSRPELLRTSALVLAVRLGRVDVVRMLLDCSLGTLNTPDAWGYPPLSYAMFMLSKEATMNSDKRRVMCIVDTLLANLPDPNLGLQPRFPPDPRERFKLATLLAKAEPSCRVDSDMPDASCCASAKFTIDPDRTLVKYYSDGTRHKPYHRHTVMNPLVLAVVMNDIPRMCFMISRCNGSLMTAYVSLPDLAIYCRAEERYFSRCHSICGALQVAVCNRRFKTVKFCLDLGAAPNVSGMPCDDVSNPHAFEQKMKKLQASIEADRKAERDYQAQCAEAARARDAELAELERIQDEGKSLPDETEEQRKARAKGPGLMAQLSKLKRIIGGIEIPLLTKPHPWVSPLHLAGRFGQQDIAALLLERGAMVNGGAAAVYAKRSPVEEAALYARNNFQAFNSKAARQNHYLVQAIIQSCIPPMNSTLVRKEVSEKANQAAAMLNPIQAAIKAASLAAKMLISLFLEMRKRPVVHWDPTMFAAHVFLNARAPLDPTETQTGIIMRDVMDNSTWRWVGEDLEKKIDDEDWQLGATEKIRRFKLSRNGYNRMLDTDDLKEYRTLKRQLLSNSDSAYFSAGAKAMLGVYNKLAEAAVRLQAKRAEQVNQAVARATKEGASKYKQDFMRLLDARSTALKQARAERAKELSKPFAFEAASFVVSAAAELEERKKQAAQDEVQAMEAELAKAADANQKGGANGAGGSASGRLKAAQGYASGANSGATSAATSAAASAASSRPISAKKAKQLQMAAKPFKVPTKKSLADVQASVTIGTSAAAAGIAASAGAALQERLQEEASNAAAQQLQALAAGMLDPLGVLQPEELVGLAGGGLEALAGPSMQGLAGLTGADLEELEASCKEALEGMGEDDVMGAMAAISEMQEGLYDMLDMIGMDDFL